MSQRSLLFVPLLALGIGVSFGLRQPSPTRIAFLDVGQGDATLVQHQGVAVLVDAGPVVRMSAIRAALARLRVGRVDLLLLTHPDKDHVAGTAELLDRYPQMRVGVSAAFRENAEMRGWLAQWRLAPPRLQWLESGSAIRFGDAKIQMDCPIGDSDNEASMWSQVRFGSSVAVLTGDAPWEAELRALRRGTWAAQLLKAGHHGSRGSTSAAFLRAVRPEWLVVSCGRTNGYGHPAPEVLARASAVGARVVRTDLDGDLVFEVRDGRFVRAR